MKGEHVSANFQDAYGKKLLKAEILEKMVPSMLFWDTFFIPPFIPTFLGINQNCTGTEHELDRLFKW
jgi:hypothetical protein